MSKTLKYVKDFDFSSAGKTVGLCKGGMAKKGYAEGGKADLAQDKAMIRAAVHKHERKDHPGTPLTKLAQGGSVLEKATGERYASRSAMAKHEKTETPRMQREEVVQRTSVKAPAAPQEMLRDTSRLGIQGNKNPGIGRRRMPVAPREPMIQPYAKGGKISNAGMKKIPKVMNEFKAGELHSGSKKGPVVTNPKQATAIALSEARAVKKK